MLGVVVMAVATKKKSERESFPWADGKPEDWSSKGVAAELRAKSSLAQVIQFDAELADDYAKLYDTCAKAIHSAVGELEENIADAMRLAVAFSLAARFSPDLILEKAKEVKSYAKQRTFESESDLTDTTRKAIQATIKEVGGEKAFEKMDFMKRMLLIEKHKSRIHGERLSKGREEAKKLEE